MAGFGDLPIGGGMATPQAAPQSSGGGGILQNLYNMTLAPTVNSVGGALSDIPKIGSSIGYLGKLGAGIVTGNQKAVQNATAHQRDLLNTTNFIKNYTDPNLGKALGKSANQVLNIAAPAYGAEEFAGKTGLRELAGTGAKLGTQLGAAGGAATAMSQGQSFPDVVRGAAGGAVTGALTGAAGGALGAGLGRLAGKAATTVGKPGGVLANSATKAGVRSGTNELAQQAVDFSAADSKAIASVGNRDKQGEPVGIRQVSSFLRGLGMPQDAAAMERASSFMNGTIDGHLIDATQGVEIPNLTPADTARTYINTNPTGLGKLSARTRAGAAQETLDFVRKATANVDQSPTVENVLGSIRQLEDQQGKIRTAAFVQGNTKAMGQYDTFQAVIDHLKGGLNSSEVNDAISGLRVSPTMEAAIRQDAVENGISPQMAEYTIKAIDNAHTYGDMRSAMHIPTIGGKLADVAKEAYSNSVPQATKGGFGSTIPSWEIAMSLHNPAYLAAGVARTLTRTGVGDRLAAKVNPAAFAAAREGALAPDAVTAQKLAQPGGAGAPPGEAPPIAAMAEQPPAMMAAGGTPPPGGPGGVMGALAGGVNAARQAPGQVLGTAGGRQGLLGALTGQASQSNAQSGTAAPEVGVGAIDAGGVDQFNQGATTLENGQPTVDANSIPGGTLQDLQQEIQQDPKNAAIYEQIYADAQKQVAASAPPKLNATEAKNLTNIQNATITLSNYVQGLNSLNKSNRGLGTGTLSALLGRTPFGSANDTTAARLQANREELAIQLAQAMNNGTKPQNAQIEQIKEMIPAVNDPKALADQKMESLGRTLQGYLDVATASSTSNRDSGNTSALLQQLQGGQ